MSRESLLQSATQLNQPAPDHVQEYSTNKDHLVAELNRRLASRQDLPLLIGPNNQELMEDNHRNHALFMESLFRCYNPIIFVDTVIWVYSTYRARGFRLPYWPIQLDTWLVLLQESLSPPAFEAIAPFYRWLIHNQPEFVLLSEKNIQNL
ncbi:MAG: hypothetical protein RBU29_07705 [bacterium]|jgi:hypothetical protein|nr:hypothetical protein [bacterium]